MGLLSFFGINLFPITISSQFYGIYMKNSSGKLIENIEINVRKIKNRLHSTKTSGSSLVLSEAHKKMCPVIQVISTLNYNVFNFNHQLFKWHFCP